MVLLILLLLLVALAVASMAFGADSRVDREIGRDGAQGLRVARW